MHRSIRSFLVVASLTLCAGQATGAVFIVAPPFSIQVIVDTALLNGDPFDTILCQPGVYREMVTVDFTGTIQEGLVIAKNTSQKPKVTEGFLIRDSRLVTINGFRIDSDHGDDLAAVRIRTSTAVAIVNCNGFPGDDGGVDATDTFEVVVDRCDFSGMNGGDGIGVRIEGLGCHLVDDTYTDANAGYGVWIEADNSLVRDVHAFGNGGGAPNAGIYMYGHRNEIRNCVANQNIGHGVYAAGTCTIKGTKSNSNTFDGIRYGLNGVTVYDGGSIWNCQTKRNGKAGINLRADQRACVVRNNKVFENGNLGIRILGDQNQLYKNNCRRNEAAGGGGQGILIGPAAYGNCLEDNFLKENAAEGIRVEGHITYLLLNVAQFNDSIIEAPGATGNDGHDNVAISAANDFP